MNLVDIKERTNIFTNCSLFFAPCLSALMISCCKYFLITVNLKVAGFFASFLRSFFPLPLLAWFYILLRFPPFLKKIPAEKLYGDRRIWLNFVPLPIDRADRWARSGRYSAALAVVPPPCNTRWPTRPGCRPLR